MIEKVRTGEFAPLAARDSVFPRLEDRKDIAEQIHVAFGKSLEELIEVYLGHAIVDVHTNQCKPGIKELWDMLEADTSGRGQQSATVASQAVPAPPVQQVDDSDEDDGVDASHSDDGTDSCSSSAESAFADVSRDYSGLRLQSESALPEIIYRHVRTKMVHMANADNSSKTACGRLVGDAYSRFFGDVDRAYPHCLQCFGNL